MTQREEATVSRVRRAEVPRRRRWLRQPTFPYHWDADELVGRRELLRFAVLASGALFAATAGIAALGRLTGLRRVGHQRIAAMTELAPGQVKYFTFPTPEDQAMLLRLHDGRYVAYSQRCTHLSCAVYLQSANNTLVCPCHNGIFDPQTGDPIGGPPQRPLSRITLVQESDALFAVEEAPQ